MRVFLELSAILLSMKYINKEDQIWSHNTNNDFDEFHPATFVLFGWLMLLLSAAFIGFDENSSNGTIFAKKIGGSASKGGKKTSSDKIKSIHW